jgi:hypothetical protein
MKSHVFGFALLSVTTIVASAPAHAQSGSLTRSFVSSSGVDSNACTIAAPCATFATAYTKIGANGIVAALDPGKYGPIAITGPVTINGNGWAAITAPATAAGITITAGSGDVTLTGLEIDGAGAAYNGIVFNTGSSLTINDCIVKDIVINNNHPNVTGNGILIQPLSGTVSFVITNTVASNNGSIGINYLTPNASATATGVLDHVVTANNANTGIQINTVAGNGLTTVAISNSIVSNNPSYGIAIADDNEGSSSLPVLTVSIDNTAINGNGDTGLLAEDTPKILLGRSVITGNDVGLLNLTTLFYTYKDNRINGNRADVSGNALITDGLQ